MSPVTLKNTTYGTHRQTPQPIIPEQPAEPAAALAPAPSKPDTDPELAALPYVDDDPTDPEEHEDWVEEKDQKVRKPKRKK